MSANNNNKVAFPLIARSKSIQSELNNKTPALNFFRIKRNITNNIKDNINSKEATPPPLPAKK